MPFLRMATHQLYAKATNSDDEEAERSMDQIFEVAGGAMIGFGTVYIALEHAAKVLGKSIANNSVQIIGRRYYLNTQLIHVFRNHLKTHVTNC
jgi:hypothetical protein